MADELDDLIEQEERAKDIATDLNNVLRGVESTGNKLVDKLLDGSRTVVNFDNAMKHVLKTMKGLPDSILTTNDLQREMLKDAELFGKVQAHTLDLMGEALDEVRNKVNDLNTEMGDTSEVFEKSLSAVEEVSNDITDDFDVQFKLLKRQVEQADKLSASFQDVKGLIDGIGDSIRNPAKGAEGFLSSVSQFPKKLMEAKEETGSWGGALSKIWGDSKAGKFVKMLSKGGPLIVGIVAITAAAVVMWKLFKNFWDFMDKKIVPATAEFNKQIGGSGSEVEKLKAQTMATGVQFELLGLSFEEGASKVRELALGMHTVNFDKETLKTGLELVSVLGLSGEEAGRASAQFTKQTGSLKGMNEMLDEGAKEAKAWGIPVNQVLGELAGAPEILARFGVANRMEFAKSTALANSYGLSIKEVDAAFGKQMDTFDGTAEAAAKLNTIFGTNINSMDLMLETDPVKRMQMVRKELVAQGKDWGALSKFEQNVIADTLGVDKAQAALILSSDKQRKVLERQKRAKESDAKANERWTKGITSIKKTLLAWGAQLDNVMRAVTNFIAALFGFDKPGKMMTKIANSIGTAMQGLAVWLNKTAKSWRKGGDELGSWGKVAKFVWTVMKTGAKIIGGVLLFAIDALLKPIEMAIDGWSMLIDLVSETQAFKDLANWLNEVAKDIDAFWNMEMDWGAVWDGAVITAKEVWNDFIDWFSDSVSSVGDFFVNVWNSPMKFFKSVGAGLMESWESFTSFFEGSLDTIKNIFTDTWDTLSGYFPITTAAIELVWDGVTAYFKFSIDLWTKIFTGVVDFVGDMFTDPVGKIKEIWQSLSDSVSDIFNMLPSPIQKALGFVGGIISGVIDDWKNIFQTVADFVGDMFTSPVETIKGLFTSLAENVKDIFGGALEFLSDPVEGFKKGFESIKGFFGADSADDALLADGKVTKLNPKDSIVAMQDDPRKILDMLQGQLPDLSGVMESVLTDVPNLLSGMMPDFSSIMETVVAQLPTPEITGEAINNVSSTIAQEVSSLAKAIEGLVAAPTTTAPKEGGKAEIIQVNLHLDGKKISESQVRISRDA